MSVEGRRLALVYAERCARSVQRNAKDVRRLAKKRKNLRGDVIALRPKTVGDLGEGMLLRVGYERSVGLLGDAVDRLGRVLTELREENYVS